MPNYSIGRSYANNGGHPGSVNRAAVRPSEVEAETATYHGAMTVKPTKPRQRADNWFAANLKALGLFAKCDLLCVFASETEQAGLLNLIKRSHDATVVVQPTWVANQGYTGNTSSMYVRSNYIPGTQGVSYSLNSASIGAYIRTNVAQNGADLGANDGSNLLQLQARSNANVAAAYINQTAATSNFTSITDSRGLNTSNRRDSANAKLCKNGIESSFAVASVAVVNREIFYCCRNGSGTPGNYTNRQIAAVKAGGGLTAAEVLAEFIVWEQYLDSFGAGVI
jgi:hypothetical protein